MKRMRKPYKSPTIRSRALPEIRAEFSSPATPEERAAAAEKLVAWLTRPSDGGTKSDP